MSFDSNAHTHTQYCDGKNTAEEMIEAAKRLGFVSLGFSGHARQGFDAPYSMEGENQQLYLEELRCRQKRQLASGTGPRLWVGIEQDTMVEPAQKAQNLQDFDYIVGSSHYICSDFHGSPVSADGNLEPLRAYLKEVHRGDMLALVKEYFDVHTTMLLAERPDIIGHFDLIRKHAVRQGFFDPEGTAYRKLALAALNNLEGLPKSKSIMEVNTGGMTSGFLREPYPTWELLAVWREMGGQVTLTSDCHDEKWLDYAFEETLAKLKKLGYRQILRLGTGQSLWDAFEC